MDTRNHSASPTTTIVPRLHTKKPQHTEFVVSGRIMQRFSAKGDFWSKFVSKTGLHAHATRRSNPRCLLTRKQVTKNRLSTEGEIWGIILMYRKVKRSMQFYSSRILFVARSIIYVFTWKGSHSLHKSTASVIAMMEMMILPSPHCSKTRHALPNPTLRHHRRHLLLVRHL